MYFDVKLNCALQIDRHWDKCNTYGQHVGLNQRQYQSVWTQHISLYLSCLLFIFESVSHKMITYGCCLSFLVWWYSWKLFSVASCNTCEVDVNQWVAIDWIWFWTPYLSVNAKTFECKRFNKFECKCSGKFSMNILYIPLQGTMVEHFINLCKCLIF